MPVMSAEVASATPVTEKVSAEQTGPNPEDKEGSVSKSVKTEIELDSKAVDIAIACTVGIGDGDQEDDDLEEEKDQFGAAPASIGDALTKSLGSSSGKSTDVGSSPGKSSSLAKRIRPVSSRKLLSLRLETGKAHSRTISSKSFAFKTASEKSSEDDKSGPFDRFKSLVETYELTSIGELIERFELELISTSVFAGVHHSSPKISLAGGISPGTSSAISSPKASTVTSPKGSASSFEDPLADTLASTRESSPSDAMFRSQALDRITSLKEFAEFLALRISEALTLNGFEADEFEWAEFANLTRVGDNAAVVVWELFLSFLKSDVASSCETAKLCLVLRSLRESLLRCCAVSEDSGCRTRVLLSLFSLLKQMVEGNAWKGYVMESLYYIADSIILIYKRLIVLLFYSGTSFSKSASDITTFLELMTAASLRDGFMKIQERYADFRACKLENQLVLRIRAWEIASLIDSLVWKIGKTPEGERADFFKEMATVYAKAEKVVNKLGSEDSLIRTTISFLERWSGGKGIEFNAFFLSIQILGDLRSVFGIRSLWNEYYFTGIPMAAPSAKGEKVRVSMMVKSGKTNRLFQMDELSLCSLSLSLIRSSMFADAPVKALILGTGNLESERADILETNCLLTQILAAALLQDSLMKKYTRVFAVVPKFLAQQERKACIEERVSHWSSSWNAKKAASRIVKAHNSYRMSSPAILREAFWKSSVVVADGGSLEQISRLLKVSITRKE